VYFGNINIVEILSVLN